MRYQTKDELSHFNFADVYIADIQVSSGFFHLLLDNVTILPDNSCNRDIREMRANQLLLKIEAGVITSLIQEGYKVYDANGNLKETLEDTVIPEQERLAVTKTLVDGMVYSLEYSKEDEDGQYRFTIDAADERTYQLIVAGRHDTEEWDRFLNK